jgi:hypothetical protein
MIQIPAERWKSDVILKPTSDQQHAWLFVKGTNSWFRIGVNGSVQYIDPPPTKSTFEGSSLEEYEVTLAPDGQTAWAGGVEYGLVETHTAAGKSSESKLDPETTLKTPGAPFYNSFGPGGQSTPDSRHEWVGAERVPECPKASDLNGCTLSIRMAE